ncbi:unnamed protein product [Caenorhabditis bovis]|uniref:Uncharacterized protein n=1 Tax=Caenorhabditis bovis TaxID=2654633 RepID=A0A8S1F1V0_9PELO|nr:unnamed protein product [Caenorhabditis bovis]
MRRWSGSPRRLLLFLIVLLYRWSMIDALVCPIPTAPGGVARNKTCPDFKASPLFTHCCTSKLPPTNSLLKEKHGVYCCSADDFENERYEAARAEIKTFIKDYLALMIFGFVLIVSLVFIITAIICKKIPGCPMYRNMHMMSHRTDSPTTLYRPVDQIPPKMYEAPPPYECFVPPPTTTTTTTDTNDWNCILENEVNGSRRTPPVVR